MKRIYSKKKIYENVLLLRKNIFQSIKAFYAMNGAIVAKWLAGLNERTQPNGKQWDNSIILYLYCCELNAFKILCQF